MARLPAGRGPHLKTITSTRRGVIGLPIHMVKGVAGKFMPFFCTFGPPRSPCEAQCAIAFLGFFMGHKEGHGHFLTLQYLSDQRGHAHVTRIEGEVDRLLASGLGRSGHGPQGEKIGKSLFTDEAHGPASIHRAAICPR